MNEYIKNEIKDYVYEALCDMKLKNKKEIDSLARSLQEKLQKELITTIEEATKEYLEDMEDFKTEAIF